jgi:transposase
MMSTVESRRSHHLIPRRTSGAGQIAEGRRFPFRTQRAQIICKATEGLLSQDIARSLHISRPTVRLWRQRFLALQLPELEKDAPRPGRIPRVSHRKVQAVVPALHTKTALTMLGPLDSSCLVEALTNEIKRGARSSIEERMRCFVREVAKSSYRCELAVDRKGDGDYRIARFANCSTAT